MFLDQGELSDQGVDNERQGTLASNTAEEASSSGKKPSKNQKLLLVVLLVLVVLALGYVLFGMVKTGSPTSTKSSVLPGPTIAKVTTTTQPINTFKVTKNPFVPVGSPGVVISNPPSASQTTSTTTAGG